MSNVRVTPKQLEIIALCANGYTLAQIASMKYMSTRAVEQRLENAKNRNAAKNITQLCVLCLDAGLIEKKISGYEPNWDPEMVGE